MLDYMGFHTGRRWIRVSSSTLWAVVGTGLASEEIACRISLFDDDALVRELEETSSNCHRRVPGTLNNHSEVDQ
jgi:hypothetical protein